MGQPEFDDLDAEYWARQIRVGAFIAAGITLLGAVRVHLDWTAADQWLLGPLLIAALLQAASVRLPWNAYVRRVRTRRALVAWWVAELPLLYLFARHDESGMLLYLPGATLILVLATALFSPAVVVGLGVFAVSGFLALLPYQSSFQTVAVLGMVLIMASVVAVNAIIAHNRGRLDARRQSAERRIEALLEHSSDLVVALAAEGRIRYASPSVAAALGRRPDQLTGDLLGAMVHPEDLPRVRDWIGQVWTAPAEETARTELRLRQADGATLFVDAIATNRLADPDVQAVIVSLRDIGTRRALEQQLSRQAFTDSLTGLANRALFRERLQHAIGDGPGRRVTLVLIDLDDFKDVNDDLGHSAGDELLTVIADRLRRRVRPQDTLARLGGDEFALLIEGAAGDTGALAETLLSDIREPVRLGSRELHLTASLGIADNSAEADLPADALLRNADLAMYAAKKAGRNAHAAFDPAMYATVLHEAQQRADMEQALIDEQFTVHYQPVVDLETAHLTGVEALVRWQHPREGLLGPTRFIHHAETSGLIVPLGRWVLRQACRQLARWQQTMPAAAGLRMNVNLSARQFQHPGLLDDVTAAVRDAGIAPESLTLEITESMLMDDVDAAVEVLHALRRLGIHLAIDDFGTGYSSLSYLQRLPVDTIKIDRSFVEHVDTDPDDLALAEAVVNLARALGLRTVAEGIETSSQRDILLKLGCRHGQGYLFSRPLSADRLGPLLRNGGPVLAPAPAAVAPAR